jgi:hypothetical protein
VQPAASQRFAASVRAYENPNCGQAGPSDGTAAGRRTIPPFDPGVRAQVRFKENLLVPGERIGLSPGTNSESS